MDHSEGIQIPKGVLPQVTRIKPGLALLFKSPQMDVRILTEHITYLDEKLSKLRPSFTDANATGDWQSLQDRLARLRKEAIANGRLFFVVIEPFAQRELMLQALADHVFVYAKCMNTTLFHAVKRNGALRAIFRPIATEVVEVGRAHLTKPERKFIRIELPEGMDQDVAEQRVKAVLKEYQQAHPVLHQISAHHHAEDQTGRLIESIYRPFVKFPSRKNLVEKLKAEVGPGRWPYRTPVQRVSFTMNSDLMLEVVREDEETDAQFFKRFDQALKQYLANYDLMDGRNAK